MATLSYRPKLACAWSATAGIMLASLLAVAVSSPELHAEPSLDDPTDGAESHGAEFTAADFDFFRQRVQPILQTHCIKCHGGEKSIRGGLRLANRESVLKGGDTGPALRPGKPDESLLIEAVNYESYEMPPSGKLPADAIGVLTEWVARGAPWDPDVKLGIDSSQHDGPPQVTDATKRFWSFQPVRRPAAPEVQDASWIRNPIDAFLLAKLESSGLRPNAPAERAALLRRATYDLTGLPPTPAEVEAYLADRSPDAYERLIDRLLDSPHYGEKWARYWLDLVRYAETNSYERDGAKPHVWRYRDYVIRSLNDDKPYDQFVREQLAGDEFPSATAETVTATGYYRLGLWDDEPADPVQALYDDLDDLVTTTGQAFLGLTVNCARCHDHKLDPFPQTDYYRFLAFFRNVQRYGVRSDASVAAASVRDVGPMEKIRQYREELKAVDARIKNIVARVRPDFSPLESEEFSSKDARRKIISKRVPRLISESEFQQYVQLTDRRTELQRQPPEGMVAVLCVKEHGVSPPASHLLIRGNHSVPGQEVQPGFPSVLSPPEPTIEPRPEANSSGRRTALADWIASSDNPLTARVMVNRIWQHHFGRGIVRSPNNFGLQGIPPTHPELLDWLASEFVARGWRLKAMHRLIMTSAAYRMSSRARSEALAQDPENELFWRFNMRRLTAEEVRDSILSVNGRLHLKKMYGPSIYPVIPEEVLAGQSRPGSGWQTSAPEERARRSIYIHVKRSLVTPILASFDVADADFTCPERFETTQPAQALGMLNGEFLNGQAEEFASFVEGQGGGNAAAQVEFALRRALQRPPSDAEITRGAELLEKMQVEYQFDPPAALRSFCLLVYNLNEFVYLD